MDTIVPAPTSAPTNTSASTTAPMTPEDLRAFLTENAQEQEAACLQARRARYLSAAIRRSETLFTEQGYTMKPFTVDGTETDFPGLFIVTKPDTTNELGFTEFSGCYSVKCSPDFHHCTCPAFATWNECKHHLAVARELEQEAALEAEGEAWDARAEFYADAAETYYHRAA